MVVLVYYDWMSEPEPMDLLDVFLSGKDNDFRIENKKETAIPEPMTWREANENKRTVEIGPTSRIGQRTYLRLDALARKEEARADKAEKERDEEISKETDFWEKKAAKAEAQLVAAKELAREEKLVKLAEAQANADALAGALKKTANLAERGRFPMKYIYSPNIEQRAAFYLAHLEQIEAEARATLASRPEARLASRTRLLELMEEKLPDLSPDDLRIG